MRRAERLFRLVNVLRERGVSRAADLAQRLEVSTATIYRDIAHLQASGLPIEGEAGVGYILRPGFDLPPVTFTHDQIDALAIGLAFVERSGDPALIAAAREARAKLQSALPDPDLGRLDDAPFRSLNRRDAAPSMLALVRAAIRGRHVLGFDYTDAARGTSRRCVQPLVVWMLPEGWMLSAWCRLRQDFRTFRSDRMARLHETGDTFADDPQRGLDAFLATESCDSH